jgi:hypothetical protein
MLSPAKRTISNMRKRKRSESLDRASAKRNRGASQESLDKSELADSPLHEDDCGTFEQIDIAGMFYSPANSSPTLKIRKVLINLVLWILTLVRSERTL